MPTAMTHAENKKHESSRNYITIWAAKASLIFVHCEFQVKALEKAWWFSYALIDISQL